VSFLTTFEEWVDRSFSRIFPAGRRFTLEDVAATLEKEVLNKGGETSLAALRVIMNEVDLKRLKVSAAGASVFLQSALGRQARMMGRPDSGKHRVEVRTSDTVRVGEWRLDVETQEVNSACRTVFVESRFEEIKSPAFILKEMKYILLNEKYKGAIIDQAKSNIIFYNDKISIGRYVKSNHAFDIAINDMSVTGRKAHAFVSVKGNAVTVLDNQSTNGVTVNSRKVRRQALSHGDEIGLGRAVLRFEWVNVDIEVME